MCHDSTHNTWSYCLKHQCTRDNKGYCGSMEVGTRARNTLLRLGECASKSSGEPLGCPPCLISPIQPSRQQAEMERPEREGHLCLWCYHFCTWCVTFAGVHFISCDTVMRWGVSVTVLHCVAMTHYMVWSTSVDERCAVNTCRTYLCVEWNSSLALPECKRKEEVCGPMITKDLQSLLVIALFMKSKCM